MARRVAQNVWYQLVIHARAKHRTKMAHKQRQGEITAAKLRLSRQIKDLLKVHATQLSAMDWPPAQARRREFRLRRSLIMPLAVTFCYSHDAITRPVPLHIDRHGNPYVWKITQYEDCWVKLNLMSLPLHALGLLAQDLRSGPIKA